jgi:hypothetical protein
MRVVFPVGSQQTVSKDTTNTSTKVSQRAVSGRIYAQKLQRVGVEVAIARRGSQ